MELIVDSAIKFLIKLAIILIPVRVAVIWLIRIRISLADLVIIIALLLVLLRLFRFQGWKQWDSVPWPVWALLLLMLLTLISGLYATHALDQPAASIVTGIGKWGVVAAYFIVFLHGCLLANHEKLLRLWGYVATVIAGIGLVGVALSLLGQRTFLMKGVRASSTLGDPNMLAVYLVASMIFMTISQSSARRYPWWQWAILLAAFVATSSRGGLLFLLMAAVGLVLANARLSPGLTAKLTAAFIALVAALDYTVKTLSGSPHSLLGRLKASVVPGGDFFTGRLPLWKAAYQVCREYPLLGIGRDNFRLYSAAQLERYSLSIATYPHQTYLGLAAELGIAAPILFLSILGDAARLVYKAVTSTDHRRKRNAILLGTILLGVAVQGLFLDVYNFRFFWVALGILYGSLWLSREPVVE